MSSVTTPGETLDHIIVFPYNLNLELNANGDPEAVLSVLSCMAIDGAVLAWEDNKEAQIVIPGATCYPSEFPDTADFMMERAQNIAGVPGQKLVGLHELSDGTLLNNTHLQAEAVRQYFEDTDYMGSNNLTVPLSYHMRRAHQACELRGIKTDYVSAENILARHGRLEPYRRYLPLFDGLKRSEQLLNAVNIVDRRGRFLSRYTQKVGARMVDFVETEEIDEAGNPRVTLHLENMSAAEKFQEVTGQDMNLYEPATLS